jgi:riboflavin kinase/FMN adenylyltransferase
MTGLEATEKIMICLDNIEQFHMDRPTALTIGKFDGLHRGHQKLVGELMERKKQGLKTLVFTFDMPPATLTRGAECGVLTTNRERAGLLAEAGVDVLLQCPLTPEIMGMEPENFVEWIVRDLKVRSILVGTDCRFGHERRGDWQLLEKLRDTYGYELVVVEKLRDGGQDISSTSIRQELLKGHMGRVRELLGRPFSIEGQVVSGNRIGRTIDAPTANLIPEPEKLLPPFGVYAVEILVQGETFRGIANIGRKPTVAADGTQNPVGVEVHIFDFHSDIYGQWAQVAFYEFLRPEQRFDSILDLQVQIKKDIVNSERYFTEFHKR